MKKSILIILFMATLWPLTTTAQQRNRNHRQQQQQQAQPSEAELRIAQMVAATQKVVFIDSVVVPLNDFISHIPLSSECGKLTQEYGLGHFVSQLNDHRLSTYTSADSTTHIVSSHLIGKEWTNPEPLPGLNDASANYPYLMPDGITLYFAQKGEKSIGGYDIFVTRYDSDSATYLRPENIGMPFSSVDNDYLYVVDDLHELGYFVTDRRQPAGKVCIYTFIPNEVRQTYSDENLTEEQLKSLARIDRIADTWGTSKVRHYAQLKQEAVDAPPVVNMMQTTGDADLDQMIQQAETLQKELLAARNDYARADENDRNSLRNEILKSERELEALQLVIRQKEKMIVPNN